MSAHLLVETILVLLLICQTIGSPHGISTRQINAANYTWSNAVKACKSAGTRLCPSSKLCTNETIDPTLLTFQQENDQNFIAIGDNEDQWVSFNRTGFGCSPVHFSKTEFRTKMSAMCFDGNSTSCSLQRIILCCDSPESHLPTRGKDSPESYLPTRGKVNPCRDVNPCEHGWCRQTEDDNIGYECICGNGFQWDQKEKKCIDIDECDESLKLCQNRKRCYNIVGTYICECGRGYYLNRTSNSCVDLNECATGTDRCLINADCENVEGHYRCKCKNGFVGNGYTQCHLDIAAAKDFKIECNANKMKLTVPSWLIKLYGRMHLQDPTCVGLPRGRDWVYIIRQDLSSCGTTVEGIIDTGTPVEIDWSCSYLSENIRITLKSGMRSGNTSGIPHIGKVDADGYYENTYGRHPSIEFDTGTFKYDADEEAHYYGSKMPAGFSPKKPAKPILTEDVPGTPLMRPIIFSNGTVIIPGFNASLPEEILKRTQEEEANNGIKIQRLKPQVLQLPNATGIYELLFWPFTDSSYRKIRLRREYDSQELMHLRVLVDTGDLNIAVVIDKCWGTPDQDAANTNSLLLISDGCASKTAVRGTVNVESNGQWRTADFRVQVFTFKGSNATYIHCRVDLCNKKTHSSCKPECEQNINRRKRSADEISNKITLTTATTGDLTLGPFYIHTSPGVLKESGRDSDNEGRIKPLHTISYALPLILIAIVILGVVLAIVAKRYRNTNTGRIRGRIEVASESRATQAMPMI